MQSKSSTCIGTTAEEEPPHSAAGRSYQPLDVVQLANLPRDLQDGKRFVCWREESRNGKGTKVPVNARTGNEGESDNPNTWSTLAGAVMFYQTHSNKLRGVGRMFDPADGIIGVDFDDCLDNHRYIILSHAAA